MANTISNVRPTAFPRLDTLSADTGTRGLSPIYQRREYSYVSNLKSQPRGRTGILEGYSRFVAALTGEEEVCFQFVLRNDFAASASREVVTAGVSKDAVDINRRLDDDEQCDFGLELLADLDHFDSTESVLLDCVSV